MAPENTTPDLSQRLRARAVLSPLDWHFATVLAELTGERDDAVVAAATLVSRAVRLGHVCLDLEQVVGGEAVRVEGEESVVEDWPALGDWLDALRGSSLVCDAGGADRGEAPLVLEFGRLYSRRYWLYERNLARELIDRCGERAPALAVKESKALLDRLFGPAPKETDWQRVAAAVALSRGLCVVSGGPGTGKTHTVAKLLVLLAENERARVGALPEVLLLAPTGKAAHRLGESLAAGARELECAEDVRALVAGRAMTIHRALGRDRRWRTRFRHHRGNRLRAGIVVVDEASMVDISLMSRLLEAVAPEARVVLLGDRDQLASVEAGAILADVCGEADRFDYSPELAKQVAALGGGKVEGGASDGRAPTPRIRDAIVQLRRNYRYDEHSDIGRLAVAINAGDVGAVLHVLTARTDGPVALRPGLEVDASPFDHFERAYDGLFVDAPVEERLRRLDRFRVLCAVRRGPLGVEGVNQRIEEGLRAAGRVPSDGDHYPGRPVMVLHNDAETELFNGDVGLLVEGEGGGMRAHFRDRAEVRSLSIARVPAHETVYAMTIHKSQGSEFDEVAVVLPDQPSPLLTRELLYTAVTRARRKVTIYASPDIVAKAVEQRVARASGLVDRLWSRPPAAVKRRR